MNQVPIRLGPLALLLTIISICMTTLSILTYTTSEADLRLAEKYAETVRVRYELEAEGQAFVQEAESAVTVGLPLEAVDGATPVPGGGIKKTFEKEGTVLTVQLAGSSADTEGRAGAVDAAGTAGTENTAEANTAAAGRDVTDAAAADGQGTSPADRKRRVRIVEWKVSRQWEEDGNIGNIWMPE